MQLHNKYTRPTATLGMTLIEVLIALAIVSVALTAVIKAVSQNIRVTEYLQRKTIATWVADEVLSEIRTGVIPLTGIDSAANKKMTMLNQDWYWRAEKKETPNPAIREIVIQVFAHDPERGDETSVVQLNGYIYHAT